MQIPSFIRLQKTDYSAKYNDLLETLALTLNNDLETLYTALNKNLTLNDNLLTVVSDIVVRVDTSGIPIGKTQISLNNKFSQIAAIQVGYAINQTTASNYPTSAPFISFTQNGSIITINHITGLTANDTWLLHTIVYGQS